MALGRTRAELLNGISSKELTEWMVYAAIEPFGEERADLRSAIAAAAIVNHLRALAGAKGRAKIAKIEDFLPFREQYEPTAEELRAKWLAAIGRKRV